MIKEVLIISLYTVVQSGKSTREGDKRIRAKKSILRSQLQKCKLSSLTSKDIISILFFTQLLCRAPNPRRDCQAIQSIHESLLPASVHGKEKSKHGAEMETKEKEH